MSPIPIREGGLTNSLKGGCAFNASSIMICSSKSANTVMYKTNAKNVEELSWNAQREWFLVVFSDDFLIGNNDLKSIFQ